MISSDERSVVAVVELPPLERPVNHPIQRFRKELFAVPSTVLPVVAARWEDWPCRTHHLSPPFRPRFVSVPPG
jgi:hypothetical protein